MAISKQNPYEKDHKEPLEPYRRADRPRIILSRLDQSTLNELNDKIANASTKVDELVTETKKQIEQLDKRNERKISTLKKEVDDSKNRVVETLALFAALFTFLSLQVQIFKDQTDHRKVLSTVLVTSGIITFFVLILDIMIKTRNEAKGILMIRFFLLLGMSVALITAGVLMTIVLY